MIRRRLEDFDTWLAIYAGAPQTDRIRRARTTELWRQRALQDAAALDAHDAMDRTDWVAAGRAIERCAGTEIEQGAACRHAAHELDARFLSGQVAQAAAALDAFQFQDADLALYRCTLVDRRDDSPCAVMKGRVPLYLALAELAAARRAWQAKDGPGALAALARCQAFDTFQPDCAGLERAIVAALAAVSPKKKGHRRKR